MGCGSSSNSSSASAATSAVSLSKPPSASASARLPLVSGASPGSAVKFPGLEFNEKLAVFSHQQIAVSPPLHHDYAINKTESQAQQTSISAAEQKVSTASSSDNLAGAHASRTVSTIAIPTPPAPLEVPTPVLTTSESLKSLTVFVYHKKLTSGLFIFTFFVS